MAFTCPALRNLTRTFIAVGALIGLAVASARAQPTDGKTFESPRAAGDALVTACEAADAQAALVGIFGSEAIDLIATADEAYDTTSRRQLAALARQKLDVSETGDSATLVIGFSAWPFPVPLVRAAGAWRFDLAVGRREILARRIGRNELEAIALLKAYPDAQRAYAAVDRDGDGTLEFARRLASTPGTHDGLYWETAKPDDEASPFGPLVAAAGEYGAERRPGAPWFGYRFKVLSKQGANAPGGAYDYVGPKGDMLGGFALVAWPAEYRKLGVMTFVVGREGRVFQKDLGEKTADLATAIDSFDPDASWTAVDVTGD